MFKRLTVPPWTIKSWTGCVIALVLLCHVITVTQTIVGWVQGSFFGHDTNFVDGPGVILPLYIWGFRSPLASQSKSWLAKRHWALVRVSVRDTEPMVFAGLEYWTHEPYGSLSLTQLECLIPWASPQRAASIHTYIHTDLLMWPLLGQQDDKNKVLYGVLQRRGNSNPCAWLAIHPSIRYTYAPGGGSEDVCSVLSVFQLPLL